MWREQCLVPVERVPPLRRGSSCAARVGRRDTPRARRSARTRSRRPATSTCRPDRGGTPGGWCPCGTATCARATSSARLTMRAPPSPQMKFFVSWKLSEAKRPRLPSGRPSRRPNRPCALSSTSSARGQAVEHVADPVDVAADPGVVDRHDGAHRRVHELGEVARDRGRAWCPRCRRTARGRPDGRTPVRWSRSRTTGRPRCRRARCRAASRSSRARRCTTSSAARRGHRPRRGAARRPAPSTGRRPRCARSASPRRASARSRCPRGWAG